MFKAFGDLIKNIIKEDHNKYLRTCEVEFHKVMKQSLKEKQSKWVKIFSKQHFRGENENSRGFV